MRKTIFLFVASVAYESFLIAQNVGLGTTSPQSKLHVKGTGSGTQIILEENAGSILRISNEANAAGPYIGTSSNHGFSIVSNNAVRMVVAANGNVGIGTSNPQSLLDLNVGGGRSLRFKNDLVPSLEVATTNSNDALAGILRFRNALEIMPSSDGTRAGKLDVRNAAGDATILLDGATGFIQAKNAAAFTEKNTQVRVVLNEGATSLLDVVLCEIQVDIPGPGSIRIEGGIYGYFNRQSGNAQNPPNINMHIKLDEYSPADAYMATIKKYDFENRDYSDPVVNGIQVVNGPGTKRYKLLLYRNGDGVGRTVIENHFIRVTYYPGSMNAQ